MLHFLQYLRIRQNVHQRRIRGQFSVTVWDAHLVGALKRTSPSSSQRGFVPPDLAFQVGNHLTLPFRAAWTTRILARHQLLSLGAARKGQGERGSGLQHLWLSQGSSKLELRLVIPWCQQKSKPCNLQTGKDENLSENCVILIKQSIGLGIYFCGSGMVNKVKFGCASSEKMLKQEPRFCCLTTG